MSHAGLQELRETVDRMERRLSESRDPQVQRLLRAYESLMPRFERDLMDERDVLISRGAALMLVQAVADA
jgi:hypothetical protein